MASTTFVDGTTKVVASWLNDVNVATYTTIPTLAPKISPTFTTPSLGVATATSLNGVTINTGVLSGTNTGDQSIFQTVAVSGQSSVVADTTSDTLTLVGGTGITITTNAATDTITFTGNTASALTLLATVTPTAGATSVSLLSVFSSTYDNYLIQIDGLLETTTASKFNMRLANAGVIDTGTNYYFSNFGTLDTYIPLTDNTILLAGKGLTGQIILNNVNSAPSLKMVQGNIVSQGAVSGASSYPFSSTFSVYTNTATVSGFTFFWSAAGGIPFVGQGTIRVYGYSN